VEKTNVGSFWIFQRVIKSAYQPLGCASPTTRGNDVSDVFYTPPNADLTESLLSQPPFFTVAPRKFMVMFIVTSGLYGIYWCFKNWSLYKAYSGRPLWPFLRAAFALIFMPSLLYKVDGLLKKNGIGRMPYWAASAAGLILLPFVAQIIAFITGFVTAISGKPYTGLGIVPLVALSIIPLLVQSLILLRAQSFINVLNGDAEGLQNNDFTPLNVLWMVIGIIYWIVGIAIAISMDQVAL
jgi:hypothetical protein